MWGLFLNFEYTVIAGPFWYGINSTEKNISSPAASNHFPRKQNFRKLNLCSKSLFSFLSSGCIWSDWSSQKDNSSFSDTNFILVKFTLIVLPLFAYAIYVLYKNKLALIYCVLPFFLWSTNLQQSIDSSRIKLKKKNGY